MSAKFTIHLVDGRSYISSDIAKIKNIMEYDDKGNDYAYMVYFMIKMII